MKDKRKWTKIEKDFNDQWRKGNRGSTNDWR